MLKLRRQEIFWPANSHIQGSLRFVTQDPILWAFLISSLKWCSVNVLFSRVVPSAPEKHSYWLSTESKIMLLVVIDFMSKQKSSHGVLPPRLVTFSPPGLLFFLQLLSFSLSLFPLSFDLLLLHSASELSYITFVEERRKERGCAEPPDASKHESSPLIWSALLAHRYLRHLFSFFKQ